MTVDIDKAKSTFDWIKINLETKSGNFILGMMFMMIPLGMVCFLLLRNVSDMEKTIEKKDEQIVAMTEREARIKDECTETVKTYFAMFKEVTELSSENVLQVKAVQAQTDAAIRGQKKIIYQATHDEE